MAQLVFLKDDRGLIRFPLRREEIAIGRGPACEITLEGIDVSRTHAVIRYREGFYEIEDRSKNGTRVNGEPLQKARLKNEDTIGIGDWRLQFLDDAAQENPETVTVASGAVVVPQSKGKSQEFAGMIGTSLRMQEIFRLVEKVAKSPATALVLGETGTGKELVANALHQTSGRALLPFVAVNCAAISENLVESELFGHERGAFTGAIQTYRAPSSGPKQARSSSMKSASSPLTSNPSSSERSRCKRSGVWGALSRSRSSAAWWRRPIGIFPKRSRRDDFVKTSTTASL